MGEGDLADLNRVQLEITSAVATVLSQKNSDRLIFDREMAEGATVGDLLADVAADLAPRYKDFHERVYNPDTGEVSDQVMIILNDNLLQFPHVTEARLNNGDRVTLAIVFGGG